MSVPLRKRLRRAIRSALLRAVVRLLAWLPPGLAFALGGLAGRVAWRLARSERRLALEHLALAFPERGPAEREAIGRASLVHLGRVALEVITAQRNARPIERYVGFAPGAEERLRAALGRRKGLIVVAGHLGNWELTAWRLAAVSAPPALTVIGRRNADPRLSALIASFRAAGGATTLWRDDAGTGREMIRAFRERRPFGILIDQDTSVQGVFVPFFGRLAFTPRAVGDLALRFGCPVVAVTCHRRGPGPGDGHELEITELPYDPEPPDRESEVIRLTAAAVAVQEQAIRRYPAEWVWMHRRWKTRPPADGSLARPVPKSRELSGA